MMTQEEITALKSLYNKFKQNCINITNRLGVLDEYDHSYKNSRNFGLDDNFENVLCIDTNGPEKFPIELLTSSDEELEKYFSDRLKEAQEKRERWKRSYDEYVRSEKLGLYRQLKEELGL